MTARSHTRTGRLPSQLRRLADEAHRLDRGTRLQVALVVDDALDRLDQTTEQETPDET